MTTHNSLQRESIFDKDDYQQSQKVLIMTVKKNDLSNMLATNNRKDNIIGERVGEDHEGSSSTQQQKLKHSN